MSTRRRLLAGTIVAASMMVAWYLRETNDPQDGAARPSATAPLSFPPDGRPVVPDLTGRLLDDSAFRLADWRGSVVVVNFWASWCPPCNDEAADLQAVAAATGTLGVRVLGVNVNDDRDAAERFVATYGVTYPNLFDPTGEIPLVFPAISPRTLPNTVIVDRTGKVALVARRKIGRDELESAVRTVAAEPAAATTGGGRTGR
ncbi:TlpA family protein disulfide reductase [Dactylosporangium sp. CS-047395]|uniref:TlpA family protein disulfide reductase n=1 Tax=Dactylosporangium sp. CS-047395 TaxID=3239936 RepID=UPI003D8B1334